MNLVTVIEHRVIRSGFLRCLVLVIAIRALAVMDLLTNLGDCDGISILHKQIDHESHY